MIITDTTLAKREAEGRPIRIGLIGAGFAARGFANQILTCTPGMQLAAVANRTDSYSEQLYTESGFTNFRKVESVGEISTAIAKKELIYTQNALAVCETPEIDVIVEATGEIEFGSQIVMHAIANHKHIVLLNAELDCTLGPILKHYADKAGVGYTQADGDQPGVLMNLYRFAEGAGFKPVMCGNIKSLIDPYRTPTTQKAFAEAHFQRPKMVTSFADGTKIGAEMATVANATGMKVTTRGMAGPRCDRVENAYKHFDLETLLKGEGVIDYILGAEPSFGVFVLGYSENVIRQRYMDVYKMGKGPLYTFYVPYHLSPIEAPGSIARLVDHNDVTLAPRKGLVCDVIAIAKKDLTPGETLDGIGGYTCYGTIDNHDIARRDNLLPMGLSDLCTVKRPIAKDAAITYDDIVEPPDSLAFKLRREQDMMFNIK